MLYQEIQKKNFELEDILVDKGAEILTSDTVVNFLDAINESIKFIHTPDNYNDTLNLFLKWESILFEYFDGTIYKNELTYALDYDKRITNQLINKQLFIISRINRIKPSVNVDNKIKYIMKLDPVGTEEIVNLQRVNKRQRLILESYLFYKRSDIIESVKCLNELINSLKDKKTRDAVETFYLSWALHALGNNFCVCELYSYAQYYYKISTKLKQELLSFSENIPRGLLLLSYYSSKSKFIYLEQFLQPNYRIEKTIEQLEEIKQEIVSKKLEMTSINDKFYNTILNNLKYFIAKNYIYSSKSLESEEMLKGVCMFQEAANSFRDTNDFAGHLKTQMHIATYSNEFDDVNARLSFIDGVLSSEESFNNNDPQIKSLVGESHLAEYGVELSLDYRSGVKDLLNEHGITPHDSCDIVGCCAC